jgi:recombination protein RecA
MARAPKKRAKAKRGAKSKALETGEPSDFITELVEALEEEGGAGTAQVLGSDERAIKIRGVISTQCYQADEALGRGGIPLGRLTIIHGKEGCGKTTFCLHLVAECQAMGGIVLYIDKEYKLDPDYAKSIGVDTKRLIISQPGTLEAVYRIIKRTIAKAADYRVKTGKRVPILIVLDSINAALAKAVIDGDEDDKHVAPQARVHSRELPQVIMTASKEDVALVFISQYRKKIGGMTFGDGNDIAGGNAPRYYASVIAQITKIGTTKEDDEKVSNKTRIECVKNQVAPPFRKGEFEIRYGIGIDRTASLLDAALDHGIVQKSGAWFSFDGERVGQGRANVLEFLNEHDDVRGMIELDYKTKMDEGKKTDGESS